MCLFSITCGTQFKMSSKANKGKKKKKLFSNWTQLLAVIKCSLVPQQWNKSLKTYISNEVVSSNDSKINGLSCSLLCLLLLLICFIGISNFLIIKIFLTSGLMTKLVSELWRHHWKLAWVSTICHETKQASLSNLYNINNSMPHFYTCVGGAQYCRFDRFSHQRRRLRSNNVLIHLVRCAAWPCKTRRAFKRESTAIRPIARPNRCSAVTLHNT